MSNKPAANSQDDDSDDINDLLEATQPTQKGASKIAPPAATVPAPRLSNEASVMLPKFQSILTSRAVREEEQAHIKEISASLKQDHGLSTKEINRIVALLEDPAKLEEEIRTNAKVQETFAKLKGN